jgi:protein phosphatase-4 regulatory subunit 3
MAIDPALTKLNLYTKSRSESLFNLNLPVVNIENLEEIESLIRNAMNTPQGRDSFMKHIEAEGWLAKLVPLVEEAEEHESLPDLHRLCNIFKSLILFNENKFIEEVVSDPYIMGVVGALEC